MSIWTVDKRAWSSARPKRVPFSPPSIPFLGYYRSPLPLVPLLSLVKDVCYSDDGPFPICDIPPSTQRATIVSPLLPYFGMSNKRSLGMGRC